MTQIKYVPVYDILKHPPETRWVGLEVGLQHGTLWFVVALWFFRFGRFVERQRVEVGESVPLPLNKLN